MLLRIFVLRFLIYHSFLFEKGSFLRLPIENGNPNTGMMINCGPNGFRCLDLQRFQVCIVESSDIITEPPEPIHECKEGFICDEENIAYCTPKNGYSATPDNPGEMDELSLIEEWQRIKKDEASERERSLKCGCKPEPVETEEPTTEFEPITRVVTEMPEFQCDTFGLFPDYMNNTLFWYCDIRRSGKGYIARHMMCEKERIFNPIKKACMIPELQERNKRIDDLSLYKTSDPCKDRPPGRYPDNDCHYYRICPEDPLMAYRNYRFACPEGTAFDPESGGCTRIALDRCKDNSGMGQKIIKKSQTPDDETEYCEIPSRFREMLDCNGYYVCLKDGLFQMTCPLSFKFDDNVFDCVPEDMAQCDDQMEEF